MSGVPAYQIRPVTLADAPAVAAIYAPFVSGTAVTFETEVLSAADVVTRIEDGGGLYPWFVAEDASGRILGYAYATRFRARNAYRFAVETTVYVDPDAHRRGIASALYQRLIDALTAQGFTQALGVITIPNEASIGFHEAMGFERSGVFPKVGYKLGAWHDVGYWQRALAVSQVPASEPRNFAEVNGTKGDRPDLSSHVKST